MADTEGSHFGRETYMRKVLGLVGATLLFAGPALAADLPVKAPRAAPIAAPSSWTGCYIGATAGGVWGKSDVSWAPNPPGFPVSGPAIAAQTPASISSSGFTGGGEIGCNYQFNPWLVVGVEGDWQYTGLSASNSGAVFVPANGSLNPFTQSFSSHSLGTIRGRVGIANGQWLFFGTGGFAIADASFSDSIFFPGSGTTNAASSSGTITGWVAGGGVEWFFMPQWSLKAEYLHVDLGTKTFTSTNSNPAVFPLSSITHSHSLVEDIGRLGVNFHF
jgi:outer membrane immunogenic protein